MASYALRLRRSAQARSIRPPWDRQVHVYRFRDRKGAEFWEFVTDRQGNKDFWS